MTTPENADLMVHDLIGRLFEEPEPLHRADLADGAIVKGMAVTRRRGFAVAGATLSVLGVVAGAVTLAGGGGGSDWSLGPDSGQFSPQAYENAEPTYADRVREIVQQLPDVFRPLLPAGVTYSQDQRQASGGTSMLTGDYLPRLSVRFHGSDFAVEFDHGIDQNYTDAFTKASVAPVAVPGGTIRVLIKPGNVGPGGSTVFTAWYQFTPADPAAPTFRMSVFGDGDTSPFDAAAFAKLVAAPGFAKLQQLLDPRVQASAAAVRQRYDIEAKINAEVRTVLPPGYRLKLSPGTPGGIELVGPGGVNPLVWYSVTGTQYQISCAAGSLCFATSQNLPFSKMGPDGKARLGIYAGWTGKSTDSSVTIHVAGKTQLGQNGDLSVLGKPVETAPQGPGLTPQQAMAIIKAPGVANVITEVQQMVAMK